MKRVYLDLDGVMADFEGHFLSLFKNAHNSVPDDKMWAIINAHETFFLDMPLMKGAKEFLSVFRINPIILTACPKSNYAHVARQKRQWVRKNLSPDLIVLPVMGGVNKPLFMHSPGDILIDDMERNCRVWEEEGGTAIQHNGNFFTTSKHLKEVF